MSAIRIAEIRKNAREEFRVVLREDRDGQKIDLRVFVRVGGDFVKTPKGVCIRPALLPQIIEALRSAGQVARREGLL